MEKKPNKTTGGFSAITISTSGIDKTFAKGIRPDKLKSLKLKYRKPDTIASPVNTLIEIQATMAVRP